MAHRAVGPRSGWSSPRSLAFVIIEVAALGAALEQLRFLAGSATGTRLRIALRDGRPPPIRPARRCDTDRNGSYLSLILGRPLKDDGYTCRGSVNVVAVDIGLVVPRRLRAVAGRAARVARPAFQLDARQCLHRRSSSDRTRQGTRRQRLPRSARRSRSISLAAITTAQSHRGSRGPAGPRPASSENRGPSGEPRTRTPSEVREAVVRSTVHEDVARCARFKWEPRRRRRRGQARDSVPVAAPVSSWMPRRRRRRP